MPQCNNYTRYRANVTNRRAYLPHSVHIWSDPQVKRKMDMIKRAREARDAGVSFVKSAPLMNISPATLYRWDRCMREGKIEKLIPRSRRPHWTRKTTVSRRAIERFVALRNEHLGLGGRKIAVMLRREGACDLVRPSRPARDEAAQSE